MPRRVHGKRDLARALAALTGVLAVLTVTAPAWIEALTGTDPDGGDGSVEIIVVLTMALVCLATGVTSRLLLRRAMT